MMCVNVYQSVICCEFSELFTTPCQNFTDPQRQIGARPIAYSTSPAAHTIATAAKRHTHCRRVSMEWRDYTGVQSSAVPQSQIRFGPFVVDRTRYRVLRNGEALDLTPKLLDLLLHLLDHAGSLVTKEQLLDALWPGANVTENALAQAVSELREALGDDAATPRFIKTVTRRGYRFIAPVDDLAPSPADPTQATVVRTNESAVPSIAVMDFLNVSGDADSAWLSAGIAETVTGDLRAMGRFRVADRARVIDAVRRTGGSLQEVSALLGIPFAVVGSYQRYADRGRITARMLNLTWG